MTPTNKQNDIDNFWTCQMETKKPQKYLFNGLCNKINMYDVSLLKIVILLKFSIECGLNWKQMFVFNWNLQKQGYVNCQCDMCFIGFFNIRSFLFWFFVEFQVKSNLQDTWIILKRYKYLWFCSLQNFDYLTTIKQN